jgi:hypothetical protein
MGRGLAYRRLQLERAKARAATRLHWLLTGRRSQLWELLNHARKARRQKGRHSCCPVDKLLWRVWTDSLSPADLGKRAVTPAMCSCWKCGNPRRHFKEATAEEKISIVEVDIE